MAVDPLAIGAGGADTAPSSQSMRIETLISSPPGAFLVLAWIGVMTILQLMRQPGTPAWDHLWAEDGGVFLSDALGQPSLTTLGHPSAGYLQVAPRLLAGITAAFPLGWAALLLSFGSALLVACLSAYAYFASSSLFRGQWARILLAGLLVLLPATAFETNASAANLHWYLIFTCFLVFVARPRSPAAVALGAIIALAAALSDPLAGLLLPLALLQAVHIRNWRGWMAPVVFALGLVAQLVMAVLPSPPQQVAGTARAADLPGIYALRVTGSFLVGDRHLDFFWIKFGWVFSYSSFVLVALLLVYGMLKSEKRSRFYLVVSFAYSTLFLAIPLMVRGTDGFLDQNAFSLNGSRYTVVPILFLVVGFLLVLDRPDPRVPVTAWSALQCSFMLFTFALVMVNYSNVSVRSPAQSWRAGVAAAHERCLTKSETNRKLELQQTFSPGIAERNAADVAIFIAPPSWAVVTKCGRVLRDT
ncbi:MAG: hypothetical protein M3396_03740 [Actinomycetota bacterium]|nr:hypothetical protein [Actinomycetota bacterium]MDQ3574507.1 hypothetical protein [Actinomycetota bacterium]